MIQKLWGVVLILMGFIGSVFYLKHQGKKDGKLEQSQKDLETGLEVKKDDALHNNDNINDVRSRLRPYIRKDR
jgi:hypothetical protein